MRRITLIHRGAGGPEELTVELDGARCVLRRGGSSERAEMARLPDGRYSLIFEDARQLSGRIVASADGNVEVVTASGTFRFGLAEPLQDQLAHGGAAAGAGEDEEIRALMPGRVVEVAVAVGDRVAPGALLLVLEAMKMQNEIRTARGGIVERVEVEAGRPVEGGARLVLLRPEEGSGGNP